MTGQSICNVDDSIECADCMRVEKKVLSSSSRPSETDAMTGQSICNVDDPIECADCMKKKYCHQMTDHVKQMRWRDKVSVTQMIQLSALST